MHQEKGAIINSIRIKKFKSTAAIKVFGKSGQVRSGEVKSGELRSGMLHKLIYGFLW